MALVLHFRQRLFDTRWFQYWCMAMTPAGFAAVLAGWFVTEIGRQPYIVYGIMRSAEIVSPVPGESIVLSMAAFVLTYTFIFGAGSYYILKQIGKGPDTAADVYGSHGVPRPPLVTDLAAKEGNEHV